MSQLEKGQAAYRAIFGYEVLSGPFHDPIQKVDVSFLGPVEGEEALIELVAPAAADSPIAKILAKGIGAYHACYEVADLGQALRHCRASGCVIVSAPAPAVAFQGRKIAWLYTPTQQLVELVEALCQDGPASKEPRG